MIYIGTIHTKYKERFGIPRQSGLVPNDAYITFEPEYDDINAFRGLETFTHIWLLWSFSELKGEWRHTVRPPKLGGNRRMGVFATRSPYHPGRIGMSCVELIEVGSSDGHIVLHIKGADILDGTPLIDIKPYIPYADSKPEASSGWLEEASSQKNALLPDDSREVCEELPAEMLSEIVQVLSEDPRPGYHNDDNRVYGMNYAGYNVSFTYEGENIRIKNIEKI